MTAAEPQGRRPRRLTVARIGVYAFLVSAALFFLLPLWIMLVTSVKPMDEVRLGHILAWPASPTFEPWVKAWAEPARVSPATASAWASGTRCRS